MMLPPLGHSWPRSSGMIAVNAMNVVHRVSRSVVSRFHRTRGGSITLRLSSNDGIVV
jgi:hypothetical protein